MGEFVSEINELMKMAKGSTSMEKCQDIYGELVDSVNARYGVANSEDIKKFMDTSNKDMDGHIADMYLPSEHPEDLEAVDMFADVGFRSAKILNGENESPSSAVVPSDRAGGSFNSLFTPASSNSIHSQIDWVSSVIYSFRGMLDTYTERLGEVETRYVVTRHKVRRKTVIYRVQPSTWSVAERSEYAWEPGAEISLPAGAPLKKTIRAIQEEKLGLFRS